MNPFVEFAEVVDDLCALSLKFRKLQPRKARRLHPLHFAKHHGTVRCSIGLQRGKTTYIKTRAGPGCLVIVRDLDEGRACYGRMPGFDVCSVTQYLDGYGLNRERVYHTIFVEDPERMPQLFAGDALWRMGVRCGIVDIQTFIILG